MTEFISTHSSANLKTQKKVKTSSLIKVLFFRRDLKEITESAEMISSDRLFQSLGALSLLVFHLELGTGKVHLPQDLKGHTGLYSTGGQKYNCEKTAEFFLYTVDRIN